ncbi:STAS domain-containing protein [Nonomuraea sp. NPDC050536]|uniref:STAS domain-containing protein n=1 Tax=Nonomuraea sp. NPDC050536 TaxID=3364366 RepID=UPI0037C5C1FA
MTVIDIVPPAERSPAVPTTVHLSGGIDIFTSKALRLKLLNALRYSTSLLIVDLSQVSSCDAGGLGVLLGIQGRARAQGITLALTGLRPHMTQLLTISGLDSRFPIVM